MDRVLKRVGLSRKTLTETKTPSTSLNADNVDDATSNKNQRRLRRRSKSRRRTGGGGGGTDVSSSTTTTKKTTRGLFNIDWDSVRDCRACKSRALTKRFCSKKCDNELYRSNSFKFERFVRGGGGTEDVSTLGKKIALCEDYSLPLDQLNKRRPSSIAVPSTSDWNISSPNEDKVVVLETYSTPRDSKQQLSQEELVLATVEDAEQKCFTSPDREYSQPYTTDASSGTSSDEEFFGHQLKFAGAPAPQIELNSPDSIAEAISVNVQSPVRTDIKRHPSPYYYSDLFKPRVASVAESTSKSLVFATTKSACQPSQFRIEPAIAQFQTEKQRIKHHQKTGYHKRYRKSLHQDSSTTFGRYSHPCVISSEDALADMSRQRHVYETAFDCRVSKSDDDLDQIDLVSNHSVLSQINQDPSPRRTSSAADTSISGLSQKLDKLQLKEGPLRGYTPSPPSTAPLPTKFHCIKELTMNSIRSAPNLPSHSKTRPIKSLRPPPPPTPRSDKDNRVLEIKDRPRKDLLLFKRSKDGKGTILEFKGRRRRRHKYSSTESMTTTTSSSGGSMESIKSSTSEGNRSTTSTDSRNSSSLSSHDSDSGAVSTYLAAQSGFHHAQNNKLHILSPISDKSSQEPVSEISDNNRNNNSQKCSPDEVVTAVESTTKSRRRLPQNKNLLNLGLEIQGSDSGISIQSREGRFGLTAAELAGPQSQDFADLPFDMPKLRRRRLAAAAQEAACTSSSATSIDFGDLPFDMPKLRRRLRIQQNTKELSVSQASSSQSVVDPESQALNFRPKLSLNLSDPSGSSKQPKPGLGLSLTGIGFNPAKSPAHDIIDVNLPLEKQGWYHGAITRVEAESVLRLLREGSFLVRNSESTKQDYSLSLKSARGFMHMRIQRGDEANNDTRSFILGQFSKPFASIPEMIRHFSLNGLPIRGAEHMCLIQPVIAQLL